jgi:RNA polymerase sigma factor (sigma-70 family)
MEEQSSIQWPGPDEKAVVGEMLNNSDSKHWNNCCTFIRRLINIRYSTHPMDLREEAVQETMLSVARGLHTFHYKSRFTTWLASIAHNCIVNELRKQNKITQWETHSDDQPEDHQDEVDIIHTNVTKTPEEELTTRELLEEVFDAMEEYITSHAKRERNREILKLVIHEGHSHEETAKILGVPSPIVGYIVRSAKSYIRTRIEQKRFTTPDSDE